MKISPIAMSGAGKTTISEEGKSAGAARVARAKAVLAGGSVATAEGSIQATHASATPAREEPSIKKIRMRTQQTPTNQPQAPGVENVAPEAAVTPAGNVSDEGEPAPAAEVTAQLSPQAAAFAKQQRALQVMEREVANLKQALAARETPATAAVDSIPISRLRTEFLDVLDEQGISYDQITEAVLARSQPDSPGLQSLKDEIKALKEGIDKNQQARDQQAEAQAIAQIGKDVDRLIAQSGETYEVIRETGSQAKVVDLIKRTFKESGEILDITEASELIEAELLQDQIKVAKIKKIQSQLQPAQPAPASNPQQIRTLTSRDSSAAQLSRRERALLAFHGKLPQ